MKKTINQTELVFYEINRTIDLLLSSSMMDGKFIGEITQLLIQNRSIVKDVHDNLVQRSLKERSSSNKLRLLYVIDSLIKHIGKDFIQLISPHIFRVFEEAYTSADEENKINLFKLYYSWKYFLDSALIESLCSRFNFNKIKRDLQRDKPELIEKYDKYNEGVKETLFKEATMNSNTNINQGVINQTSSTAVMHSTPISNITQGSESITSMSNTTSSNFESKDLKKSFLREFANTTAQITSKLRKGETNQSDSLFSSQSSSPIISRDSSDNDSSLLRRKQHNQNKTKRKTKDTEFQSKHISDKRVKTDTSDSKGQKAIQKSSQLMPSKNTSQIMNEPIHVRQDTFQMQNVPNQTGVTVPQINLNPNVQMINQQLLNWMHSGIRNMKNLPQTQNFPQNLSQMQNLQALPDYIKNNVFFQNLIKTQMQQQVSQQIKKTPSNSFYDTLNSFILTSPTKLSTSSSNLFSSIAKFFNSTLQETDPVKEIMKENKDIRNKTDILKIKDFNSKESYRDLYKRLIDSLYSDIKNSCPICGFRTKIYSKFQEHLDIHFYINFIKRNSQKKVLYRKESLDNTNWVKGNNQRSDVSLPDDSNSFIKPSFMLNSVLFYQNDNYQLVSNKKINKISDNPEDNEQYIVPIQPDEEIKCVYCGEEFRKKYIQKFHYWFYVNVVKLSYDEIKNYKAIANSLNHNLQKSGFVLIHETCIVEFLNMVKNKELINLASDKRISRE